MTVQNLLDLLRRKPVLALPSALAVVLYARGVVNGFAFDDRMDLLQNRFVTGRFDPVGIFSTEYFGGWGHLASGHYRPLLNLTYKLVQILFGLRPAPYHVLSLLAFASIVGLTVALVRSLSGSDLAGVLSGAAVAVHPLHTESVAAIVGLKELGSVGFGLWALWVAWQWRRRDGFGAPSSWDGGLATGALLLAGLLFKETALGFLPVVAGLELLGRAAGAPAPRKPSPPLLRAWVPAVAAAAAWLALRISVTGGLFSPTGVFTIDNPLVALPQPARFLAALSLLSRYLGLWIWPACLANDYSQGSFPLPGSVADLRVLLSLVGAGALLTALVWALRAGWTAVVAGLIAFAGSYLAVSNLVLVIGTSLAERLFFLPSWGLCIALGAVLAGPIERAAPARRQVVFAVLALVALVAGARTIVRVGDWHDDSTLWSSAFRCNPGSLKIRLAMAGMAEARGDAVTARTLYEGILHDAPDSATVQGSYGSFLFAQKDAAHAEPLLKAATDAAEPFHPAALDLALLYRSQDRLDDAFQAASRLLELAPSYRQAAEARGLRGQILLAKGDPKAAEAEYRLAAKEDPYDPRILYNVGACLEAQGDIEGALKSYVAADEGGASEPQVVLARSLAESATGKKTEALRSVERVLAAQPNLLPAREHWAGLMYQTGKIPEAVEESRRILQTSPKDLTALLILARAAEASGNKDEARTAYQTILSQPDLRPSAADEVRKKLDALK